MMLKKPDADKFLKAMQMEVGDQLDNGNLPLIKQDSVPMGQIKS